LQIISSYNSYNFSIYAKMKILFAKDREYELVAGKLAK
jgi:hypothetical protein